MVKRFLSKTPNKKVIRARIKTIKYEIHETRPALCRIFIHRWRKWTRPKKLEINQGTFLEDEIRIQERRCRDCGVIQERTL